MNINGVNLVMDVYLVMYVYLVMDVYLVIEINYLVTDVVHQFGKIQM